MVCGRAAELISAEDWAFFVRARAMTQFGVMKGRIRAQQIGDGCKDNMERKSKFGFL